MIDRLKQAVAAADAIVIGAGAGLSTSAGFTYSGERFEKHFSDFRDKYGFEDMYSGAFYPYKHRKRCGRSGAETFMSIDTRMRPSRFIVRFSLWCKANLAFFKKLSALHVLHIDPCGMLLPNFFV